jgi:hypothetical protein
VSGGRGERLAPPPGDDEWDVRATSNEVQKGWDDLCTQLTTNALAAWRQMRTNPNPAVQTHRHGQLRHNLKTGKYKGKTYPQWQIEVGGGARLWYLLDQERRTCWVNHAGTGHPKATD